MKTPVGRSPALAGSPRAILSSWTAPKRGRWVEFVRINGREVVLPGNRSFRPMLGIVLLDGLRLPDLVYRDVGAGRECVSGSGILLW